MRWIWIDKFISFEPGKRARAAKFLSLAEDVFHQHFPGYPIMPAPLMLEGLAQTGGILIGDATKFEQKIVLAKINKAVFQREAHPGQELHYDATIVSLRDEGSVIEGAIFLDGESLATAEIQYAHLDNTRAGQMFGDVNFVFTGELKRMLEQAYSVATPPA